MLRICSRSVLRFSGVVSLGFASANQGRFSSFKPKYFKTSELLFKNSFCFAELPKHKVLSMPALSPTMTEGKIVSWNVKEGDQIDEGDVICEVETDKATVGFESTEKGFIAKISNPEGMISVGTPVAVLTKKSSSVQAFKDYNFGYSGSSSQSQPQSQSQSQPTQSKQSPVKQQATTPSSPPSQSYPKHGMLKLPAVSPTMTEGKIIEWKIKIGDEFDVGDALFSIETDKATVDYEATQKGYLAKILSESDVTMPVGKPVAVFAKKKADVDKFKDFNLSQAADKAEKKPAAEHGYESQEQKAQNQSQSQSQTGSSSIQQETQSVNGQRIIASPLAKSMAADKNIDLSQVKGSGPDGRILKQDIESYSPPAKQSAKQVQTQSKKQPQQTAKPTTKKPSKKLSIPQNPYEQLQINSMRKTIANRLTQSKTTIPHYYVQCSVDMGKILQYRQLLNNNEEGVKISVNDMIIKATALALRDIPDANTQWHGSVIRKFRHSDVSVAVATDGGLITPIVFRAETLGLLDIARKTKDLAKRARQGKLDPSQFIGGTTTVSNLGMFGINSVTSVINPPQSTILGVGKTEKKVVFDPLSTNKQAPYKVIDSMELIVSADHRVVDGALASRWLTRIKKYLEDPVTMLL